MKELAESVTAKCLFAPLDVLIILSVFLYFDIFVTAVRVYQLE